ncbi:hypothetical protein AMK01_CH02681 [Rhizobium sp. N6212]|nr:hypothetical protein AMK02_CH02642 [Rhizobium sp. N731]ANK92128.1 hypothetical protein AMK01_CH02681 [Rhizobium sp. N6212]ANK98164.1 hypothetical protein AMK00_CH02684 [Rhizobium sp. N621]ANL04244.1 hypothetical protein AMJ99_CH02712 [Rhizobium esperanzae]ANL10361.1 hypothetical protein AMJ98_CH02713 [Rhizobium sp. N1341]ANL16458.1 hypothetical protein AMJ97_CH02640 [Rhizobium sp. N1314]ANM35091.1 hypothetical protein AMK04_CH02714 [Rhizobium sp. N871]ANM41203.1 hypothetical protein AMK03
MPQPLPARRGYVGKAHESLTKVPRTARRARRRSVAISSKTDAGEPSQPRQVFMPVSSGNG